MFGSAAEEVDQVCFVDVDPVSHAHERREAEFLLGSPVDQSRPDGPALRGDGHRSLLGDERPGRAETVVRVVDALTVRSDDTNPASRGVLLDLLLQAGSIRTRFGEPSGDDDGGFDLALAELQDRPRDGSSRDDDDGEIGAWWDLVDRFDGRQPEDGFSFWVDGDDLSAESRVQDVLEDRESQLPGLCRGADDSDTVGAKKRLERITHTAPRMSFRSLSREKGGSHGGRFREPYPYNNPPSRQRKTRRGMR